MSQKKGQQNPNRSIDWQDEDAMDFELIEEKEKPETPPPVAPQPFFLMPNIIFRTLREELGFMLGDEVSSSVLFRSGYRCGEELGKTIGKEYYKGKELELTIIELWAEIGIGSIEIKEKSEEGMVFEITQSVEALANDVTGKTICDFSRGYLTGIISSLTGREYFSVEMKCMSNDDEACIFHVSTSEDVLFLKK